MKWSLCKFQKITTSSDVLLCSLSHRKIQYLQFRYIPEMWNHCTAVSLEGSWKRLYLQYPIPCLHLFKQKSEKIMKMVIILSKIIVASSFGRCWLEYISVTCHEIFALPWHKDQRVPTFRASLNTWDQGDSHHFMWKI